MSMDAKKCFGPSDGEELSGRLECPGPGESALMPDIYAENDAPKAVDIWVVSRSSKDIDESIEFEEESIGFDPYDTAKLHKK